VRFGISPIRWNKEDLPEFDEDTAASRPARPRRLAGFEASEISNKFPRFSGIAADPSRQHKLSPISGWYSGRSRDA
jgi:inosose dehydratase